METYTIVKSILMACLLSAGFGYFFIRVKKLVRIMQSVRGQKEFKPDRLGERTKLLFTDILLQSNVRRKPAPGIAHTLIFFGFLAVQPHSLELMVQGVFPNFSVAHLFPGLFTVYLASADFLAFFVLAGLGYGLYRRMVVKPVYLTNGMDAKLIILFTSVIIITFHFYNAFHMVMPVKGFDFGACLSFSAALSSMLGLADLSPGAKSLGLEISYFLHILTILGFMVYIPGSKHLHLLAGIPNVFLKPLDVEKPMIKTDIEDENAETFGLGRVSELNWKHVLDLYSCTECGRCEERCPASFTGKPLSPKDIIHEVKLELFHQADLLMNNGDLEAIPLLVGDDGSRISREALWACTSCRGCEDICPVDIQHLDIILEARKFQVLMEADFPPELQDTFTNLENQSNPWGFSADTRADWCKDLDVSLMRDNPDAEILYFVGCSGSYDDRGIKISRAIVSILRKAGVNFAILGHEERCNGDMARRCGNEYLAQMMIRENVEVLKQYNPKRILTGCPHCFNTIKNEYPQFGAAYEVVHHTDFILELMNNGKLKINARDLGSISFHDSCYLGRWNGIYDSPREVLSMVNNGTRVVEMQKNRDNGMCCGAGGGRMFMEETIGKRINNERALEAIDTGVDIVAAACPFCITMLSDGIKDSGRNSKMEVRDLAEIVDEATL